MFSNPDTIVEQLDLEQSMTVADLGAGSGGYTFALAAKLRDYGRVYAIEVQKGLVERIKNEAQQRGLSNIEAMWGDIERTGATKLAEGSVDMVVVANVLFQVEDRQGFIKEITRILKPGGKLLIVDWSGSFGGLGPKSDAVVSASEAKELFTQAGFTFEKDVDAGAQHYGFVMKRGKGSGGIVIENRFGS